LFSYRNITTYNLGCRLSISGHQRVLPDRGRGKLPGSDSEELDPAVLVRVCDRPVETLQILPKHTQSPHRFRILSVTVCRTRMRHIVSELLRRCQVTCKPPQPGQLPGPASRALERQGGVGVSREFRWGCRGTTGRMRRRGCLRSVVGEEPPRHRRSERGDVHDDLRGRSGRGYSEP
jgi:hypothetical protein